MPQRETARAANAEAVQIKRLTLFPHPVDRDAFHHRFEAELVTAYTRLAGMLRWRVTIPLEDDAERGFHVLAELYFADRAALDEALRSAAGTELVALERDVSTGGVPRQVVCAEHEGDASYVARPHD